MPEIKENGWGLARYSGNISIEYDDNDGHHNETVHTTPSKLRLLADHWELPLPGTRFTKVLCGRYAAGWNPTVNDYDYPARLKFQEMCADHCWIDVLKRDTVKGHGYELAGTITDIKSKKL